MTTRTPKRAASRQPSAAAAVAAARPWPPSAGAAAAPLPAPASAPGEGGTHYVPGGSVLGKCALPPGLQTAARAMSEDSLERAMAGQIRDIRKLGIRFLAWHPWKQHARKAACGFLDWTLLSRRLIFRELKRQGQYPTAEQQEWLDGLRAAGQDADVWQPCCLLSGRVAHELTGAAGIGGGG